MLCVNEKCRESSIGLEIVDFLKFPRILNILLIFFLLIINFLSSLSMLIPCNNNQKCFFREGRF